MRVDEILRVFSKKLWSFFLLSLDFADGEGIGTIVRSGQTMSDGCIERSSDLQVQVASVVRAKSHLAGGPLKQ